MPERPCGAAQHSHTRAAARCAQDESEPLFDADASDDYSAADDADDSRHAFVFRDLELLGVSDVLIGSNSLFASLAQVCSLHPHRSCPAFSAGTAHDPHHPSLSGSIQARAEPEPLLTSLFLPAATAPVGRLSAALSGALAPADHRSLPPEPPRSQPGLAAPPAVRRARCATVHPHASARSNVERHRGG